MRAAFRGRSCTFAPIGEVSDEIKQAYKPWSEPNYMWALLPTPVKQAGQEFYYLTGPFIFTHEMKLVQSGPIVLCQTEAETKETFENLLLRNKKHLVAFTAAGIGGVAWAMNYRRTCDEIGIASRELPNGTTLWVAFEREVDLDTLETKVIRRRETTSEGEADFFRRNWAVEHEEKKRIRLEAITISLTTSPPPRCAALTKTDFEDLGKAKLIALQREWPRCFELFARQKTNPGVKISDEEMEDAYTLDLVANGGDPFLKHVKGGKVRADPQLISSLSVALQKHENRGKSKITDAALYLIAFNWELGWCYFSSEQLAEKLGEILEAPFTAERAQQLRYRTLGLVAKTMPGPAPKLT